jgi:hypothetical protein
MGTNIMATFSQLFIPTTGVSAASLNVTATSLGVKQPIELYREVTDGSRIPYHIPSIYSVNHRGNAMMGNYSWSNSDDWTTFHTYLTGTQPWDAERAFWHALGGYRRQNESMKSYWSAAYKRLDWGTNNMTGTSNSRLHTYPQNTSNGPFGSRVMFIRNFHPTLTKTVSVWFLFSTRWASGADGAGLQVGIPNNTTYATSTSVSWTNLATRTGSNPTNDAISGSFQLGPGKTAVVLGCNTFYYWTDTGNNYHWNENNSFYNLQGTFNGDFWIQPDIRLTLAAHAFNEHNNNNYTSTIDSHKVWNQAAALYGDR